jgi:autotransporter-associated beta strand protein
MANSDSASTSATLNLDGGTLSTNGFNAGGPNGSRNIFLNGGILQARVNSLDFLQGMSNVTVKAGGAKIDTNGVSITINQSMNRVGVAGVDGGLTKSGIGTMRLNGTNTFTGTTTITAGSIAGSGSLAGALVVEAAATVAPGGPSSGIGTFSAGNTTISGIYSCGVNGASSDSINVAGALDLTSSTDEVIFSVPGAGATMPVYIIASYTSLAGIFNTVTNLPSGYSLNYSYNGGTQIAITRPLTAYESWLATFLPGETDPAVIGKEADPDGDGQPNKIEFALGGDPDDGANNAKIYQFTQDSSDAGTAKELLLTIAVRDGAGLDPVFAPATGGSPTATQDGVTYTIEGGVDLASFTGAVSVVDTVATGLDPAPAGYEYRTFSLEGSDGLPAKGFMRVSITP